MQELYEQDPKAFMDRMASKGEGGGCPFMSSKHYDPMNTEMEFGWNCRYKSRWDFLFQNRGRMTVKKFNRERKLFNRLPYPVKHSLFHPDDIKKLRDKPFSGLYYHFDKYKEDANKMYDEGKYFDAIDLWE
jgi:hypothetical protein